MKLSPNSKSSTKVNNFGKFMINSVNYYLFFFFFYMKYRYFFNYFILFFDIGRLWEWVGVQTIDIVHTNDFIITKLSLNPILMLGYLDPLVDFIVELINLKN